MACYKPIQAYRTRRKTKNGKDVIVFKLPHDLVEPIKVPCGQCIGCRLNYSREWAIRCVHEAQLHDENSFITLTYNNENLPLHGNLVKKHFQDFMKRLRITIDRKYEKQNKEPPKIKYYMCGEYGDQSGRPHYHACIFGYDFPDKIFYKKNKAGDDLWTSPLLDKAWGNGYAIIGDVTFESAAYVARYVMKKIKGKNKKKSLRKQALDTMKFSTI